MAVKLTFANTGLNPGGTMKNCSFNGLLVWCAGIALLGACANTQPDTGTSSAAAKASAAASSSFGAVKAPITTCNFNTDCNDQNTCTTDSCQAGVCKFTSKGADCCQTAADCGTVDPCDLELCGLNDKVYTTCTHPVDAGKAGCCNPTSPTACADYVGGDVTKPKTCTLNLCTIPADQFPTILDEEKSTPDKPVYKANPLYFPKCTNPVDVGNPNCCDTTADCAYDVCATNACLDHQCVKTPVAPVENCCNTAADCDDGIACTVDYCGVVPNGGGVGTANKCYHDKEGLNSKAACPATLTATSPASLSKASLTVSGLDLVPAYVKFDYTTFHFDIDNSTKFVRCYLDGQYVGFSGGSFYEFKAVANSGVPKGMHSLSCVLSTTSDTATGELDQVTADGTKHHPEARATIKVFGIAPCVADADCADGNACSTDVCVNSQCVYGAVATCCATNADCDQSGIPGQAESCYQVGDTYKCSPCGGTQGDVCTVVDGVTKTPDLCTTFGCDVSGLKGVCKAVKDSTTCCSNATDCNDGIACTIDACTSAGLAGSACTHTPPVDGCCADSDCTGGTVCTTAACVVGKCIYGQDSLKPGCCINAGGCNDSNPCTTDACDIARISINPITGADVAWLGCRHTATASVTCCVPEIAFNDGNICTNEVCEANTKVEKPIAGCCSAGTPCNDGDTCTTENATDVVGSNVAGLKDGCQADHSCIFQHTAGCCHAAGDCDDGNPCTIDVCNGTGGPAKGDSAGTCSHSKDNTKANCCINTAGGEYGCGTLQACQATLCVNNTCVSGANSLLPGCCSLIGPSTEDGECGDHNSCTADSCASTGGVLKCNHASADATCVPVPSDPIIDACANVSGAKVGSPQYGVIRAHNGDANLGLTFTLQAKTIDGSGNPTLINVPSIIKLGVPSMVNLIATASLAVEPAAPTDAGSYRLDIVISNGAKSVHCQPTVTVTGEGGYYVWAPNADTDAASLTASAIVTALGANSRAATASPSLPVTLQEYKSYAGVFATLGGKTAGTGHTLTAAEVSSLNAYVAAGGHLYLEGANAWTTPGTFSGADSLAFAQFAAQFGVNAAATDDRSVGQLDGVSGYTWGPLTFNDKATGNGLGTVSANYAVNDSWRLGNDILHQIVDGNDLATKTLLVNTNVAVVVAGKTNVGGDPELMMIGHDGGPFTYRTIASSVLLAGVGAVGAASPGTIVGKIVAYLEKGDATVGQCDYFNGLDVAGKAAACPDQACKNPAICTAGKCIYSNAADGTNCTSGNACTVGNDKCVAGACVSGAKTPSQLGTCSLAQSCTKNQDCTSGLCTDSKCDALPVSGISAGLDHTCAVRDNGTLWCWGYNGHGQLGNGGAPIVGGVATKGTYFTPQQIGVATDWATVVAGEQHTCAIKTGGTLWCWGANGYNQLGFATTGSADKLTPTQVGASTDWTAVALGQTHTCATKTGGTLWCWGDNSRGQSAAGATSTVSLDESNNAGLVAALSGVTAIGAGDLHTCALTGTALHCWGDNTYGQIGNGSAATQGAAVGGVFPAVAYPKMTATWTINGTWSGLSVGFNHACAIEATNGTKCWGDNQYGQLGSPIGNSTVALKNADGTALKTLTYKAAPYAVATTNLGQCSVTGTACSATCSELAPQTCIASKCSLTGIACTAQTAASVCTPQSQTCGAAGPGKCTLNGKACTSSADLVCEGSTCNATGISTCDYGTKKGAACLVTADCPPCAGAAGCISPPSGDPTCKAATFTNLSSSNYTCGKAGTTGAQWCWGGNAYGTMSGTLVDQSTNPANQQTPVKVFSENNWTLSPGYNHSCGLVKDAVTQLSQPWCWGRDVIGAVGNGPQEGFAGYVGGPKHIAW